MKYISTANPSVFRTLSDAMMDGMPPDGGLFVPEHMPRIDASFWSSGLSYPDFSSKLLAYFFKGDRLADALPALCDRVFHFPVPLKRLDNNLFSLELFHGPTSSFKDFGAHFLAECLNTEVRGRKTIMVATSGDTGSAVASAFYRKSAFRVIILYPQDQISARQEQQMTCWGDNIEALAVNGSFDDCQRLVKVAFSDPYWQRDGGLSSANSINIGRLLPQITYYAYSSVGYFKEHNRQAGFIIPTGNLGNATAAYWAMAMGFPIRDVVLATNANRTLADYLTNGVYQPQQSIATMANAMDVGHPNNLQRLNHLFPTFEQIKQNVRVICADDDAIRETLKRVYKDYGYIICPHTATAFYARQQLDEHAWIIAATADPCKFDGIIEPVINARVPLAPQLQRLLERPNRHLRTEANLDAIRRSLS